LTVDGRLKPMDWVIFRQNRLECSMARMHAKPKPVFVARDWVPSLPRVGMCMFLILAGMLVYQLTWQLTSQPAGPNRIDNGSGIVSKETDTIRVAPPSFMFEGGQQGQIHFESDARW
jgi:hypothetical protein